ncbi:sensor histidine kinase [Falsibacillus pallidus]|uniref:histidine kinase n=1 Tax=Falsibacillus pallidus TaxID=493781 RepID=A0A370G5D8_9BACI|nr:HAMP domain-containing sensor histidine kinase [Falsibacillus pallidus]RDI38039.1 signal transduction histidine kinase [Falsibacillus pallidus]
MKLPEWMRRILEIASVLFLLIANWSLSYWITSWIFPKWGFHPGFYFHQIINSISGFFLFGCCMFLISRLKWVQKRQYEQMSPLIHAMKMMAEGNFNIDLSYYHKHVSSPRHPYFHLIQNINDMAGKLGEMEQMRQEFISNVSHEFQSPLTSISGFAHALKNDALTAEERLHYLDIIEKEGIRLSKLSDNLLKLTSLESEHPPFESSSYRLDHQLRRIVLSCEPHWTEKNLNMEISLDNLLINADEDLMDQVWINLLVNSIKFTPAGGTIAIEAREENEDQLAVRINDTGIGMDEDAVMHMFERFYKADESRTRTTEGSGLGLSIVKKIIDLHHGEIRVDSELGKGTEILVVVPKGE